MHKDNLQTNYRMELPAKIMHVAMREFRRCGVKAVKMDDIASRLSISKRTLYEIFSNKEELLLECVRMQEEAFEKHMIEFSNDNSHSSIDIILEFYRFQMQNVSDVSPVFYQELSKYGHVMEYLNQKRIKRNANANEFFARAVSEGHFRKDVDFDIVSQIGAASMEYAMKTEMYEKYVMKDLLHNILFLFLRGLCTAEGIALLDSSIVE